MCAMFVLFCAVCVVFASGRARPSGRSRRAWWRRLPRSTGKSRAAPSSTTRARRHRSCKRGHKKAPRALHSDRLHSGQVQFDVCIRPYSYKIQAQRKPPRSKVRNNKKMKRTENEQGNRGVLSVVYKCITLHSVHWRDVVSLRCSVRQTNERHHISFACNYAIGIVRGNHNGKKSADVVVVFRRFGDCIRQRPLHHNIQTKRE